MIYGYNGNCIGFNGNYGGVYWYVMDSIGGMLNPIGKMPKHNRNVMGLMVIMGIVLVLTLEKANGILMEPIGFY